MSDYLNKKFTFKTTKARSELLNALANAAKPLCYDDFELKMDKATFYRNIAIFENENIINKFESEERKWYYEIAKTKHAHFICKNCKEISCIDNIPIDLNGYIVDSVIIKGICSICNQSKAS